MFNYYIMIILEFIFGCVENFCKFRFVDVNKIVIISRFIVFIFLIWFIIIL